MRTGTPSCLSNNAGQYRKLLTHQPHPLKSLDQVAVMTRCHRGQEICSQGRSADCWYCVMSGAARRCVIRLDGRRQIVDLLLPGDVFGFTAGDEYDYTVEAVPTRIRGSRGKFDRLLFSHSRVCRPSF